MVCVVVVSTPVAKEAGLLLVGFSLYLFFLPFVTWSTVNAASKGHLPVVLYLLTKQGANPLVRNNWGETAYDAAAAVFEVWICEVLQKAEAERWRGTTVPYNPLSVHTTVPLVLYENQRLDTRLKTLAVSGGRPRFSASGLGRRGRLPPFELKLPSPDEETGAKLVASWRSDVQLPLTSDPYVLPKASHRNIPIPDGAERSHFWLSDWTLDVTHPGVDAEAGWEYAQSFSASDEAWSSEPPPQLERLLSGSGAVTAGLPSPVRSHSRGSSSTSSTSSTTSHAQTWVRRRRWVRVMRRRLDIPPLPFMEPDGAMYHLALDGSLILYVSDGESDSGDDEGQELGAMRSNPLSSAQDYVARARYLVGNQPESSNVLSPIEARRAIAKLERATMELRQGSLSDEDAERKTHAEVLLNTYSRELERRRLSAGAQGLLISGSEDESCDDDDDDGDDDDEVFHYPGYSPAATARAPSVQSGSAEYISRPLVTRVPTDLTPHLSQAPEFRVPTREAPQKMVPSMWQPTPHALHAQWERDDAVYACNDCRRRFSFILRRHCRRCGRIFCDRCSSHKVLLDPSEIVHDPAFPEPSASSSSQRVCQCCFDEHTASVPERFRSWGSSAMERIVVDQGRLMVPGQLRRQDSSSQLSDLAECPVCSTSLADLGLPADQEVHVRSCLEGGTGSVPQAVKYLVYKLPAESALLGVECVICLEEFTQGSVVARLSCFCSFHNTCLTSWLQRGRSCPVHAR
ncbi:FYVE-domain-containing protein [Gyrodon lividus]|nr:FYVE-domain-containing protein [Gyrodon lividus]